MQEWVDSTRDAFGSGTFDGPLACHALTTLTPDEAEIAFPPTYFGCAPDGREPAPAQASASVPAWFRERPTLPLCGVAVTTVDIATYAAAWIKEVGLAVPSLHAPSGVARLGGAGAG